MGNISYDLIPEESLSSAMISPYHKKGKAYGILVDLKLKNTNTEWTYITVYDLRNGKPTWRLYIKLYGNEIELQFYLIRKKDNKDDFYFYFPLRWSSSSNTYMTIFKGYKEGKSIYIELYGDNIHSQRIANLKLDKFRAFGFIKFDEQDKIPIAF